MLEPLLESIAFFISGRSEHQHGLGPHSLARSAFAPQGGHRCRSCQLLALAPSLDAWPGHALAYIYWARVVPHRDAALLCRHRTRMIPVQHPNSVDVVLSLLVCPAFLFVWASSYALRHVLCPCPLRSSGQEHP